MDEYFKIESLIFNLDVLHILNSFKLSDDENLFLKKIRWKGSEETYEIYVGFRNSDLGGRELDYVSEGVIAKLKIKGKQGNLRSWYIDFKPDDFSF